MKHPDRAALALHSGDDLSGWARWRMLRHLAKCDHCRDEVSAFQDLRQATEQLSELPALPWDELAAEMTANIRLGLSAGECVKGPSLRMPDARRFPGWQVAVATVSILILVTAGIVLEAPRRQALEDSAYVQADPDGIGSRHLKLMHPGASDVLVSASAEGSVQQRYVDRETCLLTVSQIDAQ